jgi:hypothetical protein
MQTTILQGSLTFKYFGRARFRGRVKGNIANWKESHMATWLCYGSGACCIIWALMQIRTTLVYMGVLKSAIIGEFASPPLALIHVAIEKVISYSIIGILLFVSPWPRVVTYIVFVLLLRAVTCFWPYWV